jgi:hypothetical protein
MWWPAVVKSEWEMDQVSDLSIYFIVKCAYAGEMDQVSDLSIYFIVKCAYAGIKVKWCTACRNGEYWLMSKLDHVYLRILEFVIGTSLLSSESSDWVEMKQKQWAYKWGTSYDE